MKLEPLKGKLLSFSEIKEWIEETSEEQYDVNVDLKKIVVIDDLKSAVEWLKQEIHTLPKDISRGQLEVQLFYIIPKAFEDAIENDKDR